MLTAVREATQERGRMFQASPPFILYACFSSGLTCTFLLVVFCFSSCLCFLLCCALQVWVAELQHHSVRSAPNGAPGRLRAFHPAPYPVAPRARCLVVVVVVAPRRRPLLLRPRPGSGPGLPAGSLCAHSSSCEHAPAAGNLMLQELQERPHPFVVSHRD